MSDPISSIPVNIKDAADAVKGIAEAVPIYQDAIQPAAREVGKGLQTIAKTIHIALAPISLLVWGYEKIQEYILPALEEKLKNVPKENITTPDPAVAGPALEALRFLGPKEDLRELFANLLATAMNSTVSKNAHPSFVEIIKQLSSDEAKIIKSMKERSHLPLLNINMTSKDTDGEITFARNISLIGEQSGCSNLNLVPSYLDNLHRLGLIDIPEGRFLAHPEAYKALENHSTMQTLMSIIKSQNSTPVLIRRFFHLSNFGLLFRSACV